ncbi:MAG: hypothetical protein FJ137_17315 [Deltaproteobacteria bacterium]|nr:hypothetical protein [Deltaproteobacteria bacterium]
MRGTRSPRALPPRAAAVVTPQVPLAAALALWTAVVAGCGAADVRIVGTVDGRGLRAVGTVAAWMDQTAYVVDGAGGHTLERRDVGDTALHVRFFEHVFDPTLPFDRLPADERAALEGEIASGDGLDLIVARGAALREGDDIVAVGVDGVPEVLPFIASLDVGLRDGSRAAEAYPEALPSALVVKGSPALAVVTVSPRLQGELRFSLWSADGEEKDFSVSFATALLPERTGECSFDRLGAGAVEACTLAPLSTP